MNLRTSILCMCLFLFSFEAVAQFGYGGLHYGYSYRPYESYGPRGKKRLQRYYVGYSYTTMHLTVDQHYTELYPDVYSNGQYIANPAGNTIDTSMHMTIGSNGSSYGIVAGGYYPISYVGPQRSIGLDISSVYNQYVFSVGDINYSSQTGITEEAFTIQAGFPIAFVYKFGGETDLNKKHKFLYSFGAGVAPTLTISKIITVDAYYNTRPFAMAEVGYFLGIAFKLRATAYLGKLTLVNQPESDLSLASSGHGSLDGLLDVKAIGKSNFTLSLMLLPFSWHWGEEEDDFNQ